MFYFKMKIKFHFKITFECLHFEGNSVFKMIKININIKLNLILLSLLFLFCHSFILLLRLVRFN